MWLSDLIKTLPQYCLPQHSLSWLMGKLTRFQGGRVTRWIIQRFINYYAVDMSIAHSANLHDYASFNQFFTRALRPDARPLASATLISPVDGEISQIGQVKDGLLLQAKDHYFRLHELLGGYSDIAALFTDSLFCTLYLAPRDYHRIHMPVAGRLMDMVYIPGRLFSVNQRTSRVVPNLFARNERVVCVFDTEMGYLAVILVGALFVGSMETVWAGTLTSNGMLQRWNYPLETAPFLTQGAEMGRFNMGSTVIVLANSHQLAWLSEGQINRKVLMGQALADQLPVPVMDDYSGTLSRGTQPLS